MNGAMDVFARVASRFADAAQQEAYPRGAILPLSLARVKTLHGLSMFLQSTSQQGRLSASDTVKTPFNYEYTDSAFGPKVPAAPHRTSEGGRITFMESKMTEYEWAKQITWHEINLQSDDILSPENSQKLYSVLRKTEEDFVMDPLLKMEKTIFAAPTEAMFTGNDDGEFPLQSIWTKVNLWDTIHGVPGENLFPGMTDQQGLDPEDSRFARKDGVYTGSQLAPTKLTYSLSASNSTASGHMLENMDFLLNSIGWESVPLSGEFGAERMVSPRVGMCSREAIALFQRTNRAHGELFATLAPIGNAKQGDASFGDVALMACDSIRNAKIYPDTQNNTDAIGAVDRPPVDEFDTDGGAGGRYYFFDPENINLWFQRDRAWEQGEWKSMEPLNEDIYRRLGKSIMQMHAEGFMTTGVLYPDPANPVAGYGRISS